MPPMLRLKPNPESEPREAKGFRIGTALQRVCFKQPHKMEDGHRGDTRTLRQRHHFSVGFLSVMPSKIFISQGIVRVQRILCIGRPPGVDTLYALHNLQTLIIYSMSAGADLKFGIR